MQCTYRFHIDCRYRKECGDGWRMGGALLLVYSIGEGVFRTREKVHNPSMFLVL